MKVIRIHRRRVEDFTIFVEECSTIWLVTIKRDKYAFPEVHLERHKKREHKSVEEVLYHVLNNTDLLYRYNNGVAERTVRTNYKNYLYLKMCYGVDGLTEAEHSLYKTF